METVYKKLAGKIQMGHSERIAKIFSVLVDETSANLMLAMPGQPVELSERTGLALEEVDSRLQDLFVKGAVFKSARSDPPSYYMVRNVPQFHDATIVWPQATKEFLLAWRDFMDTEWHDLAKVIAKMMPKPLSRVIPVGISIQVKNQILNFESINEIIDNAKQLAVTPCTCRLSMGKCDRPVETCIQVNRAAEYTLERGSGREISKEEAREICRNAEKEGLVHVTMNKHEVDAFICNCCPCCCLALPELIKAGTKVLDPSRYVAEINADECTGCEVCHERCYFEAITWGDDDEIYSVINPDKCMGCGLCMVTCPADCIELKEIRPEDFVPLEMKH